MRIRFLWIWLLLINTTLLFQPLRGEWELRERKGREFVTLKSFCEFYDFPYHDPIGAKSFKTSNPLFQLELTANSRICFINGTKHWLNFGSFEEKGEWILSKMDLIKHFEPIFRPHLIPNRRPIQGIILDPGHGGSDKGATNSQGQKEKKYALDLAFRIEKLLSKEGIPVIMTRRSDTFVGLRERVRRAKPYKDYLFVSLHFNSAARHARGLETYACAPQKTSSTMYGGKVRRSDFQKQPGNSNDRRNILLAHTIQQELIKLYPNQRDLDRGVKRARFVVLKENELPSVLVEGGFLSNRQEANLLEKSSHRQNLAEAIAQGIHHFMALMDTSQRKPLAFPSQPSVTSPVTSPPPSPAPSSQPPHEPPTLIYPTTLAPSSPTQ